MKQNMNPVHGSQRLRSDCMKLALTEVRSHIAVPIFVLDNSPLLSIRSAHWEQKSVGNKVYKLYTVVAFYDNVPTNKIQHHKWKNGVLLGLLEQVSSKLRLRCSVPSESVYSM